MSDTLRAPRRHPAPASRRRWTVAALATGLILAPVAQAHAVTGGKAATATASTGSGTPAKSKSGPATANQGSPAYYDSGLDPTPYMGWNTYYGLGSPTQASVESVANYLVSSGLAKAGYNYVWLDGGWQASTPRNGQGELVANPTEFPAGIPALVNWLHARGLKVGIYTDAGVYNSADCGLA